MSLVALSLDDDLKTTETVGVSAQLLACNRSQTIPTAAKSKMMKDRLSSTKGPYLAVHHGAAKLRETQRHTQ